MFSLIITIVSIALVVALVAATMYYGGDTLTEGRTRADAAAFVSGGQQIAGAMQLFNALEDGAVFDSVQVSLIDGDYLTGVPTVKGSELAVDTASKTITSTVVNPDVCEAINVTAGEADPAAVTAIAGTYGCITADNLFTFKY